MACGFLRTAVIGVMAAVISGPSALAQEMGDAARGRALAERDCSGCHAVGPGGRSPLVAAPPFRDLHKRYDVEDLAESLAEGIVTGHPAMPSRPYPPKDVRDLIAFLRTLEPASPR
jgi:cytochrome c